MILSRIGASVIELARTGPGRQENPHRRLSRRRTTSPSGPRPLAGEQAEERPERDKEREGPVVGSVEVRREPHDVTLDELDGRNRGDEPVDFGVVVPALEKRCSMEVALTLVDVRGTPPELDPERGCVRKGDRQPPIGPHAARELREGSGVSPLAAHVFEDRDARRVVEARVLEGERPAVRDAKLEVGLVACDAPPLLDLLGELVNRRHPRAVPREHHAEELGARQVQHGLARAHVEPPHRPGQL